MSIKKPFILSFLILNILWIFVLRNTDSYIQNYILLDIVSLFSILYSAKNGFSHSKRTIIITTVFATILSLFVSFAHIKIVATASFIILLISSVFVFFFILIFFLRICNHIKIERNDDLSHKKVFLLTFFLIFVIDLFVLFLGFYPGVLTVDSINQLNQITTGVYSNHHPFYHTIFIKLFYEFGLLLFKNTNAAAATYFFAQIIIISITISFSNLTLYQLHRNKYISFIYPLIFVLTPYNMFYSITMWKDIVFGIDTLFLITVFVRIFKNLGNQKTNYCLLSISSIVFCLFRSNGLYAFVIILLLFLILFRKTYKNAFIIIFTSFIISIILVIIPQKYLNVMSSDLIESLSIPSQQIARVICYDNDLNDKEIELLSKVIDIDRIPSYYKEHISDGIKELVRQKNNQQYIKDNAGEFISLYINIGIKHPLQYITAWVEQTKGYFNNGYDFYVQDDTVCDNTLGIYRTNNYSLLSAIIYSWLHCVYNFKAIISIGINVWLIISILYVAIISHKKDLMFLSSIILSIICTLLIATPVFCEFRYIYSLFTCYLFLLILCLYETNQK